MLKRNRHIGNSNEKEDKDDFVISSHAQTSIISGVKFYWQKHHPDKKCGHLKKHYGIVKGRVRLQ